MKNLRKLVVGSLLIGALVVGITTLTNKDNADLQVNKPVAEQTVNNNDLRIKEVITECRNDFYLDEGDKAIIFNNNDYLVINEEDGFYMLNIDGEDHIYNIK